MRPPALTHPSAAVFLGDCLDVLAEMPDDSVDAIVTDPPYGLGFMGKAWDDLPPGLPWAQECLRVLKPGGHLLAFGGTRTWHRLAVAIEDAGFEVRDSIAWLYGSGFPKSMDVSKAIDKAAGATREVTGRVATPFKVDAAASRGTSLQGSVNGDFSRQTDENGYRYTEITAPSTPAAQQWAGWGTALKPAFEPIVVARKPLVGTVAANVLAWGTGALNIDATRVNPGTPVRDGGGGARSGQSGGIMGEAVPGNYSEPHTAGRWPTNVVLDDHAAVELDEQSGIVGANGGKNNGATSDGYGGGIYRADTVRDKGGASRFFPVFKYQAKAPTRERPSYEKAGAGEGRVTNSGTTKVCRVCGSKTIKPPNPAPACGHDDWERVPPATRSDRVAHPTVKPLALMRWLVRLVTPPGGTVLDTFAGSGATIEAAVEEGFYALGIEREADYLPLIQVRLDRVTEPDAA